MFVQIVDNFTSVVYKLGRRHGFENTVIFTTRAYSDPGGTGYTFITLEFLGRNLI